VRVTSTGKLVRSSSWKSHLLEHKSKKRKRKYEDKQPVDKADRKAVRRALAI
jgi:ribosomal protein L35